ncbi:MAG: TonB-dependent receptor, partial [Alistipes sp.]|nr:TonB-dependent receptor [Alistipes sp.]
MKRYLKSTIVLTGSMGLFAAAHAQGIDSLDTRAAYRIDEVVVTGTRSQTDARLLPMTVSVVGRQRIEESHSPSLLPTLWQQVPGLFVTSRGTMGYGVSTGASGAMTLRGIGNGSQGTPTTGLLVLIDGHPQYMGLMGHPIADACQSMLAERVEVVRGPASVLYGSNAMGGVINIVTRKMKHDGTATDIDLSYGSYNTLHTEASNRIRKGGFESVVTASYNRSDGNRKDMDFEQYGGMIKLGYELSKSWRIGGDANITHFNASNPGTITAPLIDNDSRITRGTASLALQNDYGSCSGALSLFYNWGRHKIDDGYSPGAEPLDYRFNSRDLMLGVSLYESFVMFRGNRTTLGVDYQHFGGKAWNRYLDGREQTTADKSVDQAAAYLDIRQTLGQRLTLNAGIRVDRHSHVGTEWVPQAGISLRLWRDAELKAMVSKGFRFPTIREMYMFPPQNPDLKPEKLINYEISLSDRLMQGRLTYGINIFYIDGRDMINRIIVDSRPMNVNIDKVENCGVEVQTGCAIGRNWSVEANYSYLHMKYPVIAAPAHKLCARIDFRKGRWLISSGIQYINELYTSIDPVATESFVLWDA